MKIPTVASYLYAFDAVNKDGERVRAYVPLFLEEKAEDVDDPTNFFFCTHHRDINDCVHSKHLDASGQAFTPTLIMDGKTCHGSYVAGSSPGVWYAPNDFAEHYLGGAIAGFIGYSSYRHSLNMSIHWYYPAYINNNGVLVVRHGYVSLERLSNGREYEKHECDGLYPLFLNLFDTIWNNHGGSVFVTNTSSHYSIWQDEITPYFSKVWRLVAEEGFFWAREHYVNGTKTDCTEDLFIVYAASSNIDLKAEPPFLFGEPYRIIDKLDPLILARAYPLANYWWNVLTQQAYLDAITSMPRLNDNSISNIIELVGFIYNLVVKHRIEIPASLQDTWLSYRYQHTTSVLDAEEAISFVQRNIALKDIDHGISCYGVSRYNFHDTLVTCRCGLTVRPREVETLGKIWRSLYTYGLQPNFYTLWDMIPFSFMVDWFIPIGEMASAIDAKNHFTETNYDIKKICYSISYDVTDDDGSIHHQYTRWEGTTPPELKGYYFLESKDPSSKTIWYRILDTAALTIRR